MDRATLPPPRLAALAAAALLAIAPAVAADRIDEATRYTVKIRTATPVPLIHDQGQTWSGAGFLIDRERGWILTNAHIAGYGPSRVEVSFHGAPFTDARVHYVDTHLDVAVLAVPGDHIPDNARPAPYDCERRPRAGDAVVAFGHPWDLDYSATRGIVSGVSTRWNTQWIQTDAPLNSGNSGGPLIGLASGDVIGINTASIAADNVENLNFAVPMRQVCPILALLREGTDPTPAALPFTVASRQHGTDALVVARVPDDSGHDLRPGDHIVGIGESMRPPANQTELFRYLRGADDTARIAFERDGKRHTSRVGLVDVEPMLEREGLLVAGVLFAPVSRDLARAERAGRLMVHWVQPGTPGKAAGFESFDLLEAVNGEPVQTLDALRRVIDEAPEDEELHVVHRRLTGGSGWWTYNERLLPARPVRAISRDKGETAP